MHVCCCFDYKLLFTYRDIMSVNIYHHVRHKQEKLQESITLENEVYPLQVTSILFCYLCLLFFGVFFRH